MILGLLTAAAPVDVAARPRVAIIDSGVARTAELATKLLTEYDAASTVPRAPFQPRYDHGTMVATILARANPDVDIVSVRIDDPAGCPTGSNPPCQPDPERIAAAIRHATSLRVDAINISLTLGENVAITDAVREAARAGIVVVMAAGNEGRGHPGNLSMARAAYPHAVLVGAVDAGGQPWEGTNRPDAVTQGYRYAWQRGVGVPTALADGQEVRGTGTSFAAPIETARLMAEMHKGSAAADVSH